jgi:hypothetical protein
MFFFVLFFNFIIGVLNIFLKETVKIVQNPSWGIFFAVNNPVPDPVIFSYSGWQRAVNAFDLVAFFNVI